MEYKDYYKIMGLARNASAQDIKRAHRKLARQFHPDVSKEPNAEARFKELCEAYEVLRDPAKRAAYDQLGSQWRSGQDFRPPPRWQAGQEAPGAGFERAFRDPDTPADAAQFSDFFETLVGRPFQGAGFAGTRGARARTHRAPDRPGEDRHAKILIDLAHAYSGATRNVRLQLPSGQAHEISFKVPLGVRAGQRIRLAGQGAAGTGNAPAGDLYLEVQFQPPAAGQPAYRTDRHDVYLDLTLAPWEAALGTTVQAPTPTGWVELRVPPSSQPGRKLRLKGRGLPASTPGDFYFVLQLATPAPASDADRRFYEDMAQRFKSFEPRAAWQRP
jgi:curved DNA-binding protein